jgi:hypothetical protein
MFAPLVLCEHDKIIGTCEHGCTTPKGRVGEVQVPRRVMREMKHRQEQSA